MRLFAAAATRGANVVVTRCSNNFGPYQYPEKLLPLFITNAIDDEPLPADVDPGALVEDAALLHEGVAGARGVAVETAVETRRALRADTTHEVDYVGPYVEDLCNVVDLDAVREAGLKIGVDPMGGSGVAYWAPIAERYGLDLDVVNPNVDPTFRFMTLDWDGEIRMDCSSPYAIDRKSVV